MEDETNLRKSNSDMYVNTLNKDRKTWPRGYKTFFSCSPHLRLKFIMLIDVKMPTIVGILTYINRTNYYLMGFMPEFSTDLSYFSIYELSIKKFISAPGINPGKS